MKLEQFVHQEGDQLQWKINTPQLLKEVANCGLPRECGTLRIPLNMLQSFLAAVATAATRIDDPALNCLMIRMALYDGCLPGHEDYEQIRAYLAKHNKETSK